MATNSTGDTVSHGDGAQAKAVSIGRQVSVIVPVAFVVAVTAVLVYLLYKRRKLTMGPTVYKVPENDFNSDVCNFKDIQLNFKKNSAPKIHHPLHPRPLTARDPVPLTSLLYQNCNDDESKSIFYLAQSGKRSFSQPRIEKGDCSAQMRVSDRSSVNGAMSQLTKHLFTITDYTINVRSSSAEGDNSQNNNTDHLMYSRRSKPVMSMVPVD